ncbi:MAG: tetratricopeptide repeat protein [Acidobacteriota bacterium]
MKISDVLLRPFGARDPNCPSEADVLTYSENKISTRSRVRFERHFAGCNDCRELLVFLGREPDEMAVSLSQEAVSEQTNRVLAYIQNDERNRTRLVHKTRPLGGFYISYPRLATVGLVICAIAVAAVFLITSGQSPADAGKEALTLAMKDARRIEARVSGGFDHSRYGAGTRGDDRNDDNLRFDQALGRLRSALQENAPVDDRLMLARVYLARGTRPEARQALTILTQLGARGVETPGALNDTGVAHLLLDDYDSAIAYFSKALAKLPSYDEALFNKALAEERAHRDDDARRDWQVFLSHSSDDKWKTEAADHLKALSRDR